MLQSIKRWFTGAPAPEGWQDVEQWAEGRQLRFRRSRDGNGFVIEADGARAWRLEWGPSQRTYIDGAELRLRGDLGAGSSMQMLIISRLLMESLEKKVFEQYTEGLQTRIDDETPEEMRWLVLYPKAGTAELKGAREIVGGVANDPPLLPQWLDGALAQKLAEARASWLAPEDALVLIVQRARLTMRMPLPHVDTVRLGSAIALFEVALSEARRVAEQGGKGSSGDSASTAPSEWSGEGPPSRG